MSQAEHVILFKDRLSFSGVVESRSRLKLGQAFRCSDDLSPGLVGPPHSEHFLIALRVICVCVPSATGPPNSEHFFKDMKMMWVLRRFFLSRVAGEERPLSWIPLERRERPGERTPCLYLSVYLYVVRIVWARLRLKTSPKPRKVMWVGVQNDVGPPNSEHFPKSLRPECVFRRASAP